MTELVDEDFNVRVAKAIYQQEVALLPFKEQEDGRKVSFLKGGKVVLVDKGHVDDVKAGEWWFVQLAHKETFAVAVPIRKFDPEDYFDANPQEKERLLHALREPAPGSSATLPRHEVPAPLLHRPPVARTPAVERHPVVVTDDGTIELGEFAPLFAEEAEVLADRKRNALAIRPTPQGPSTFAVEDGVVVAPAVAASLALEGEGTFAGFWDTRRGMVIVEIPRTEEPSSNGGAAA